MLKIWEGFRRGISWDPKSDYVIYGRLLNIELADRWRNMVFDGMSDAEL